MRLIVVVPDEVLAASLVAEKKQNMFVVPDW